MSSATVTFPATLSWWLGLPPLTSHLTTTTSSANKGAMETETETSVVRERTNWIVVKLPRINLPSEHINARQDVNRAPHSD